MLGSIATGACAGSPTPKPTATQPGGFPIGTYKPDKVEFTLSIQFNADGTYVFALAADRHPGIYKVNGDQIVIDSADGVCAGLFGTYHWEFNGNTLLLKPIDDTCTSSSRAEDLGGRSWILQP